MKKVIIITGKKNVGKTTFFKYWYSVQPIGYGFYSQKRFLHNSFDGYDLMLLPTKIIFPLNHISEFDGRLLYNYWKNPKLQIQGNFIFNTSTIRQTESYCDSQTNQSICWMDEIGVLEMKQHKGFYPLLMRQAESSIKELRLVVRQSVVDDICTTLHRFTSNIKIINL